MINGCFIIFERFFPVTNYFGKSARDNYGHIFMTTGPQSSEGSRMDINLLETSIHLKTYINYFLSISISYSQRGGKYQLLTSDVD